jgi:hypothetical protein
MRLARAMSGFPLSKAGDELYGRGGQFGVVCGDATVGQHEHVFKADAYVDSGSGGSRYHVPSSRAVAVPQLWDPVGNQLRDRARVLDATVDRHERPA